MINPNHVGVIKGDGITTPDVSVVDVRDLNVLDDNVGCTADKAETLALDYTSASLTNDGLVGGNGNTKNTSLVV